MRFAAVQFDTPYGQPGRFSAEVDRQAQTFATVAAAGQYIARPFVAGGWFVQSITLSINGHDICSHCVAAVTEALEHVPGVEAAEVSLQRQQAVVRGSTEVEALIDAIKAAGYDATMQSA